MGKQQTKIEHVTQARDNVFTDLGFAAEEATKLQIKSRLMIEISEWIKEQQLKQEDAAKILGVSRPRVSDVMTGKIGKFTIDTLVDLLERTGKHVTVNVA